MNNIYLVKSALKEEQQSALKKGANISIIL